MTGCLLAVPAVPTGLTRVASASGRYRAAEPCHPVRAVVTERGMIGRVSAVVAGAAKDSPGISRWVCEENSRRVHLDHRDEVARTVASPRVRRDLRAPDVRRHRDSGGGGQSPVPSHRGPPDSVARGRREHVGVVIRLVSVVPASSAVAIPRARHRVDPGGPAEVQAAVPGTSSAMPQTPFSSLTTNAWSALLKVGG